MGRENSGKNTDHLSPQLLLGFLPTPTICKLPHSSLCPPCLEGMGTPMLLSQDLKEYPWLQRLRGCKLWLSLEGKGLVAAGVIAPQGETYQ